MAIDDGVQRCGPGRANGNRDRCRFHTSAHVTTSTVPGRREPKPTGAIEMAAANGECYFVRDVVCVTFGSGRETDVGCATAENRQPVSLWIHASRVTCS